jgi:Ser/Thr protein kinase RdoA (MazF antagonist)
MLADFNETLVDTLPGYHNIKFRFDQWEKVIAEDPLKRSNELQKEINWIEERKEDMMSLWTKIETNLIPKRVAHNDAKISNILFDKEFNTTCVIDLDTVLNSTLLFDFGDAIRSSANTGQEDDPNLNNVNLDLTIFKSFAEGYISQVKTFIAEIEIENLAFSARYITYEQAMRFLMDYIGGDTYYKIKSPNHNLIRARAQFKLLQSIESQFGEMNEVIGQLTKE